jgi:type II secretory pathway pseudopilin PulG
MMQSNMTTSIASSPLARRSAGAPTTFSQKNPAEREANGPKFNRSGFSFAEVMFAVVILGIGFILIAAIFPVAIQQSAATGEESNAAAIARQAAAAIASLQTTVHNANYTAPPFSYPAASVQNRLLFPPTVKNYVLGTGQQPPIALPSNKVVNNISVTAPQVAVAPPAIVVPLVGTRWDLIRANAILPNDPRFAYAAFYKRENNSSAAELIVVAMIVRNRPIFDPTLDEVTPLPYPLVPSTVTTTAGNFPTAALNTAICPDTITVSGTSPTPQEGNFVQTPTISTNPTMPLGRTYTLGQSVSQPASGPTFELVPGDALALTAGTNGLWGTAGAITDSIITGQSSPNSITLNGTGTLQATVAYATLWPDPDAPGGRIQLTTRSTSTAGQATGGSNPPPAVAAPGAFVIIADDFPNPNHNGVNYFLPPNIPGFFAVGSLNGRIFRLGKAITEDLNELAAYPPGTTFDLDPQYGMRPPPNLPGGPNVSPDIIPNPYTGTAYQQAAKVYIIGTGSSTSVNGPAPTSSQDIGVFATYFQVQ